MLLTTSPLWIVDLGATDHVAHDQAGYVEYCRISTGARWIYVGDNNKVGVKGIGTCKLSLRGGQTLYLHDVLYAPDIRRNLVSVNVLLGLGYNMYFHDKQVDIYLGTVYYGSGFLSNGFMVLVIIIVVAFL